MKKLYLPLIMLLIVSLEGVATALLPKQFIGGDTWLIPHWSLLFLVLIAMLYDLDNTYYSLLYAIIFGLLKDIVYTDMLGVYMFTYGFSIYLILELRRVLHGNIFVAALLGVLSIVFADAIGYLIYHLIGITPIGFGAYLVQRLLPTLGANLIMLVILYLIFQKPLQKWSDSQLRRTTSL
ncbi:rod shape-determining protein MreD [Terribacillus sp. 7520-G]|uniref:rod shape-determining protein MreD n=1 Tax=Terribacillus TaxID=459532 RepID=UPI000BA53B5B|nr:rod shape-determining protein MreD [Terribacillus sp. 7520-G]PAD39173.1 rod shape-determining protein MreD [Terribacillus sp. 7520-G]